MGLITKSKTWVDNENVDYTDLNADFDALYNEFNGNISNDNISPSAAITPSKIDGTAATLSGLERLKNKIVSGPVAVDTDGATVTFNMDSSNIHNVVLGGNRTLAVSNVEIGQAFVLILTQDGTGSRTVTWFTAIKWPGGTAPTLTTTASKKDVFGFIQETTGNYLGFIVGQNL